MGCLVNLMRANNLTVALKKARPPKVKSLHTQAHTGDNFIEGAVHVVAIDHPPDATELQQFGQFDSLRTTLVVHSQEQSLEVYFGTKDNWVFPSVPNNTYLFNQGTGAKTSALDFFNQVTLSDCCSVNQLGITRIRNLSNEDGLMPYRNPEGKTAYVFTVQLYRRGMRQPMRRTFTTDESTAYWGSHEFYAHILKQIIGRSLESSFAACGFPRAMATQARAEVCYISWQDFADLLQHYNGDFFRVFHYQQSWVDFFTRS